MQVRDTKLVQISRNFKFLGVFGLSYPHPTTEQELNEEFYRFGPLEKLIVHGLTFGSRVAFVYFESIVDAKITKEAMCNQKFKGRPIHVDFANNNCK